MNSNQIRAFKKLVKDNGFSEVSQIVEKQMGINYGMYLSRCEALFVLSRIRSCVHSQNLLDTIDSIHRKWLMLVIRNQWSSTLCDYCKETSTEQVIKAIMQLTENGCWGFPKAEQIDIRLQDHFECCSLIPETINGFCDNEDRASDREEGHEQPIEEDENKQESSISQRAQEANQRIIKMLSDMGEDFRIIGDFFRLCSQNGDDAYRAEQLESQLTAKQETIDNLNQRIEAMQRLSQRSDEEIERLKSLVKEKEQAFSEAAAEIKQLQVKLQQASEAKSAIPTKKIIPESKLRELVAVGDKMIRQLTPFLAQYDIIVNPHK